MAFQRDSTRNDKRFDGRKIHMLNSEQSDESWRSLKTNVSKCILQERYGFRNTSDKYNTYTNQEYCNCKSHVWVTGLVYICDHVYKSFRSFPVKGFSCCRTNRRVSSRYGEVCLFTGIILLCRKRCKEFMFPDTGKSWGRSTVGYTLQSLTHMAICANKGLWGNGAL